MVLKLYFDWISGPSRAVLSTIKYLDVPVEIITINLMRGQHKSVEYLKINPRGTVPAIDDNGFFLLDSHAINIYLATKYAKDDKLYPKDEVKRAIIHHRLFFEIEELLSVMKHIGRKVLVEKVDTIDAESIAKIANYYEIVESFLQNCQYIAGDDLSIADFSYVTTMGAMNVFIPVEEEKFPKLHDYLKRSTTWLHSGEINKNGLEKLEESLKLRKFEYGGMKKSC